MSVAHSFRVAAIACTDRVHDILCTTWPSARIFDSPKSQHSGSEIEEILCVLQLPTQPPAAGLPSLKCFIKEIWTRTRSSRAVLWLARKYLEVCQEVATSASDGSPAKSSCNTPLIVVYPFFPQTAPQLQDPSARRYRCSPGYSGFRFSFELLSAILLGRFDVGS